MTSEFLGKRHLHVADQPPAYLFDTGMVLSSKFCLLIPPGVGGLAVNVLGIQSTLSW